MKPKKAAIITVIFSTLLTAAGQFFLKRGSADSLLNMITNIDIIIGAMFYLLGAFLLIYSLKRGKLSTIYPIYSLTYIWVLIIAYSFLSEAITLLKIAGVSSIIAGVILMGVGPDD